jgi:hypothetical protein
MSIVPGHLEFHSEVEVGTHSSHVEIGTTWVDDEVRLSIPTVGTMNIKISAGGFVRVLARYKDHRPNASFSAKAGLKTGLSTNLPTLSGLLPSWVSQFELKVEGIFTGSTDPTARTDVPGGATSIAAPGVLGFPESTHGLVKLGITFHF